MVAIAPFAASETSPETDDAPLLPAPTTAIILLIFCCTACVINPPEPPRPLPLLLPLSPAAPPPHIHISACTGFSTVSVPELVSVINLY
nr:MAG TPA: hypothetical protein [Myoviridae sp. ct6nn14]